VIFETNLRTSYAAGRYAQLTDPELLAVAPYWEYEHSLLAKDPRPEHLAWHGLTLRHDHPFWATHYPPNGFGCGCRVTATAQPEPGAPTAPPAGWDVPNPHTGRMPGMGEGWDYAPGARVADSTRALAEKAAGRVAPELRRAFVAEVEGATEIAGLSAIGLATGQAVLAPVGAGARALKKGVPTRPEQAAAAQDYVLERGAETGHEFLAAYDARRAGSPLWQRTDDHPNHVAVPRMATAVTATDRELAAALASPKGALAIHHNHPSQVSLSVGDLAILFENPGVYQVVAHNANGAVFTASLGKNFRRFKDFLLRIKRLEADMLKTAKSWGLSPAGMDAHLRNMALNEARIIKYDAVLDPARAAYYNQHKVALDDVVSRMAQVFKGK
jgi:hypothetical protein